MDIYRKNPNVLYARVEHETESGVYRSDDGGANWRKLSSENPRPMYFSQIRIDPQSDSRIYSLGVSLHVSDDGGKTFRADGAERIHVDHHAMWINPANPKHVILGNDGGVSISYDHSATWVWLPNLLLAQAYHVEFDMQSPYHVCAGLQDNNTWCGPSAVRTNSGIHNDDWYVISGGDGFQPLMDPTDARIVYAESQDGRMSRTDRNTNERTTVRPEPPEQKPGDTSGTYRFNWDTAMQLSPFDASTIYIGANMVLKSADKGRSYQPISPDLTTNTDREALPIMGVPGKDIKLAKHDGVTSFGNIVTLEESAAKAGIVWVGSDDGVVSVTQDAGANWTNVTAKIPGVPKFTYVSDVVPSRAAAGTAYVTFDGHRGGDYATYVFMTTDTGNSWRSIVNNLPKGEVARTIAEDRKNPDLLYLGTETGLWVSWNKGGQWTQAEGQPADDADLRDQDAPARQRHDPGHARARHLDSRRPRHHPAVGEERRRRRVCLRARSGGGVQRRQRSDEGLRGRSPVPGHESRAGRDAGLPAEGRGQGGEVDDPRRRRAVSCAS